MRRLIFDLPGRKREWYLDHQKRLDDAIAAQEGRPQDDEYHADGIRRLDQPVWKR